MGPQMGGWEGAAAQNVRRSHCPETALWDHCAAWSAETGLSEGTAETPRSALPAAGYGGSILTQAASTAVTQVHVPIISYSS